MKVFNWLGTIWRGNIQFTTPMLNALAFVSMFIIGGLSGIFMAATPVDIYIHDTYFIVAHIPLRAVHVERCSASSAASTTGIPKMFGRMMNETWGKVHFFAHVHLPPTARSIPMHILGIGGMPRRYAVLDMTRRLPGRTLQPLNEFISICGLRAGPVRRSSSW